MLFVFFNLGDNSYTPNIRRREAVKSLSTLGVKEHDIIFLGYPDGGVHGENAVYIYGDSDNFTVRGRHETYGTKAAPDFCMAAHGFHRPFTREGMIQDMEDVVLAHKPDAILCIDYDVHPDHRACSAAFETAIGRILQRPGNKYFPVIFKGFAYKTAFESVPISMRLTCCPPFSHGIIFPNLPGKRQILPMHGMRESGFLFPRNAEDLYFLTISFIKLFAVTYHKKVTVMQPRSPMAIRSSGNAARIIFPCRLLFPRPLEISIISMTFSFWAVQT